MGQSVFDENLIARIAAGDREAFAEVYEATKSSVYGFALSILKNREDAEDVMHDTYLKLYKSAEGYVPQGKPLAFILTIVKNTAYNKLRSRREVAGDSFTEETSPDAYGPVEDKLVLDTALTVLDDTERMIVLLHAVSGMKHREIAEILCLNQSTVLSKYRRALKKVKEGLIGNGVTL
ncbi:MAG: RNA polymerase sigma factor [Eubacterium sp.]|nr:RNA polymerase sigma factor [Eubacterium sp.]